MTTMTMTMMNPFEMPLNMQQHVFSWNSIEQIKDREIIRLVHHVFAL